MKRSHLFTLTPLQKNLLWFSAILAFLYWILESMVHVLILSGGNLYSQLFRMDLHETWNQLLVIALLIGFSFYSHYIITSRRRTLKALEESDRRYRTLFEKASNPILIFDASGYIIDINKAAQAFFGFSGNVLNEKRIYDLVSSVEDLNPFNDEKMLLYEHQNLEVDCEVNGSVKSLILNIAPLYVGNQKIFYGIGQDISERKQMERDLKIAHAELNQIFQTASAGMCVIAKNFDVLKVNETFAALTGLEAEQATGRKCYELLACRMCKTEKCPLQAIMNGEEEFERRTTKQRKDGSTMFFILSAKPFRAPSGEIVGIVESFKDITALEQAQRVIRSERNKLERILCHLVEGVMIINQDFTIEYQSKVSKDFFGDSVGKRCFSVIRHLDAPCPDCLMEKAIGTQTTQAHELEISNGRSFEFTYSSFIDTDGMKKSIVLCRDITEKKASMIAAMRAEQLVVLGELAAGVAHEINNPINGIINYAQILVNKSQEGNLVRDIGLRMIKEGDRIARIVEGLLFLARRHSDEKRLSSISDLLSDTLTLTAAQLRKDAIKVDLDIPGDLPKVIVHSQEIEQVFINLISNARHALNERYKEQHEDKLIEIKARAFDLDGRSHVRTSFYDRGTGIPASILDKVTNPFVTTKSDTRSAGLGLSISNGIVNSHGGVLTIASVENHFTVVHVDLPVVQNVKHGGKE